MLTTITKQIQYQMTGSSNDTVKSEFKIVQKGGNSSEKDFTASIFEQKVFEFAATDVGFNTFTNILAYFEFLSAKIRMIDITSFESIEGKTTTKPIKFQLNIKNAASQVLDMNCSSFLLSDLVSADISELKIKTDTSTLAVGTKQVIVISVLAENTPITP